MLMTDKFPLDIFGFSPNRPIKNEGKIKKKLRTFLNEFTRDKTTNEYSSSLSYIDAAGFNPQLHLINISRESFSQNVSQNFSFN